MLTNPLLIYGGSSCPKTYPPGTLTFALSGIFKTVHCTGEVHPLLEVEGPPSDCQRCFPSYCFLQVHRKLSSGRESLIRTEKLGPVARAWDLWLSLHGDLSKKLFRWNPLTCRIVDFVSFQQSNHLCLSRWGSISAATADCFPSPRFYTILGLFSYICDKSYPNFCWTSETNQDFCRLVKFRPLFTSPIQTWRINSKTEKHLA